jgi:hypothetical protein
MGSMLVEIASVYKLRKLKHVEKNLQDFFTHMQNFLSGIILLRFATIIWLIYYAAEHTT